MGTGSGVCGGWMTRMGMGTGVECKRRRIRRGQPWSWALLFVICIVICIVGKKNDWEEGDSVGRRDTCHAVRREDRKDAIPRRDTIIFLFLNLSLGCQKWIDLVQSQMSAKRGSI
jgi:hypothetical protein